MVSSVLHPSVCSESRTDCSLHKETKEKEQLAARSETEGKNHLDNNEKQLKLAEVLVEYYVPTENKWSFWLAVIEVVCKSVCWSRVSTCSCQ